MQVFIQMQPRTGKFQGDVPTCNESPYDEVSATGQSVV